jgi:hypothetical protein
MRTFQLQKVFKRVNWLNWLLISFILIVLLLYKNLFALFRFWQNIMTSNSFQKLQNACFTVSYRFWVFFLEHGKSFLRRNNWHKSTWKETAQSLSEQVEITVTPVYRYELFLVNCLAKWEISFWFKSLVWLNMKLVVPTPTGSLKNFYSRRGFWCFNWSPCWTLNLKHKYWLLVGIWRLLFQ